MTNILYKGPIGKEDIQFEADGNPGTFTRRASLGTVTITKLPDPYKYRTFDVDALNTLPNTFTQETITNALSGIGTSTKSTLLLRPGTWVISSNADWSAYTNVTFKIVPGAVLQIATGTTTTLGGPLDAGLYQVFSCTGTGAVAGLSYSDPRWFGATYNGDLAAYIQKSVDSISTTKGGTVFIGTEGWMETGVNITTDNLLITGNYSKLKYKATFTTKTYGAEVTLNMFNTTAHNTRFERLWLQGGEITMAAVGVINNNCMIQYYTSSKDGSVKDCIFYNDFHGSTGWNGPTIFMRNGVTGVEVSGNKFINDDAGTTTEIGAGAVVTHGDFTDIHDNYCYNLKDSNLSIDSGNFNTIHDNVLVNESYSGTVATGKIRATGNMIEVGSNAMNWSVMNNVLKGNNGPAIQAVTITNDSYNGVISGNNIAVGMTVAQSAAPVDEFFGIALSSKFHDFVISGNKIEVPYGGSSYGIVAYSNGANITGNIIKERLSDTAIAAGILLEPGTDITKISDNILGAVGNFAIKFEQTANDYASHQVLISNNSIVSGAVGIGAAGATLNLPVVLNGNYFATAVTAKTANLTTVYDNEYYSSTFTHDYGSGHVTKAMTGYEATAVYIVCNGSSDSAMELNIPAGVPGKQWLIYNNTGKVLTFKVAGQTGGTIATGKYALYASNTTDVIEIFEQP